jgi:hypothetical protein
MHNHGRVHDTLRSVLAANGSEGRAVLSVTYVSADSSHAYPAGAMQATTHALNMEDTPGWQVATAVAAAALVGFSVYRERKAIRKALVRFSQGVGATAVMGLGFTPNAMGAAPNAGYGLS